MYIDFHFHTLLFKKATFDLQFFKKTISYAKRSGLDGIVMTEHFNALHFEEIIQTLDQQYSYTGNCYDVNGFKVFTGMEVDISEPGHILVIGDKSDILKVRKRLLERYGTDFASFDQLLTELESYEFLVIGAHPYRKGKELYRIKPSLLKKLDAFDLNGKDIYLRKDVEKFAQALQMPLVGGSDTHHYLQAGSVKNYFPDQCLTAQDLKDYIKQNNVNIVMHPFIRLKNSIAKVTKKCIKKYMK